MSRKDYKAIADVFVEEYRYIEANFLSGSEKIHRLEAVKHLEDTLTLLLRKDNPRFDYYKWTDYIDKALNTNSVKV